MTGFIALVVLKKALQASIRCTILNPRYTIYVYFGQVVYSLWTYVDMDSCPENNDGM